LITKQKFSRKSRIRRNQKKTKKLRFSRPGSKIKLLIKRSTTS